MNPLARPGSLRSLAVAVLLASLAACASAFPFTVRSSDPQDVDSVLVLFGDQAGFEDRSGTAEIASVIHPSKLNGYYGYAEFGVEAGEAGPIFTLRSSRLDALRATVVPSDTVPQVLRFGLPRSNLDAHGDLGIAVVVRTADRKYRMKVWQHDAIQNAQGELAIDVTAREIGGSF